MNKYSISNKMKNFCYRIVLLLTLITYGANAYTYDFKVNGIYYNKISNNEVEVTFKSTSDRGYSGEITIPNSVQYGGKTYNVTSIGESAFYNCSGLTGSLTIPNSVTTIGNYSFYRCSGLTGSLTIPNSVTSIGNSAFNQCSGFTGSLTIPNSVTFIGEAAFTNCPGFTGSLTISNSVTAISKYCFQGSSFTGPLTIPNSVTIIEEAAFNGCHGLTGSLIIPSSVTSIGGRAFQDCMGLTGLTIPNSVKSIESEAFINCKNMDFVKSEIEKPFSIDTYVFWLNNSKHKTLQVPKGTKSKYTAFTGWTKFFNEVIEDEGAAINTYTLSITASGNGSASYSGSTIRSKTSSFTLNAGSSATITFSPDNGYRIKSVKVNNADVTSSVSNNSYTINNISKNTNVEVEFEAIPAATYTLSITASGSGSASYNGTTVRSKTSTFTVNEGTNVSITFTPDNGYRIKSVKENNTIVTSYVSSNTYTISNISRNTTVEVEFEAIPSTTYTLSIKATGNGSASYNGTTIRSKMSTFTVNEGSSATITFTPDNGYRIKSVKVNNADVTSNVSNNKYTISSIIKNTTVEVEFEAIPPTTYTLSIKATGNGAASYNGTTIRSKTSSFTVNEGTSATITFAPDNGYRIKSVKVNNTDVTLNISSNKYTFSSINKNTTVEVEFEAIPPTTYTLSIKATGSGSASYNGTTIRSKTSTFTLNEGTSATITFAPDNGYRIKSVKVNNADVTSNVSNNQYTISNINKNTTVEVEFEAIPPTTYTLSIKATGNGSASYNGTTIRSKTSTFTVNEGTSATIMFTPDNGYRIKSVKENNTDVTSYVSNNAYVVNVISRDTNIEVEFEAIPATTYTLSINAYGNGYVYYNGETIRNSTRYYTVNEGAYVTINLIPDNGYQIKSFKENGVDMTSSVWSGQYIIYSLNSNTTIEVEFEAIPVTTYSLSIKASGNGSVSFNSTTIRSKTSTFTVNKGTSATITFVPDNGYRIKSVKVNNSDVTSSVSNNQYTINNISQNTTLEVEFAEELKTFADNGVNYSVMSYNDRTVYVSNGSYGSVLEVPSKITYQDIEWTVAGIDNGALTNNPDLAAIIWNPTANFTVSVGNPNLLLYVKSASYAPTTIKNVIVNNVADNITLADAASGNNFYCPQEFTAKSISYTHNYGMITGIGESRGWETIALPFDVQKITHSSKGEIVPFTNWKSGDSKKPFWLMELGTSGFVDASAIKPNTPYIISMPNHTNYKNEFRMNGNITFSAQNVKVKASNNLQSASSGNKTFHPNYMVLENTSAYALNVNNDYVSYSGGSKEGSTFVLNLRKIHPFEAYMTSASKARQTIAIQDNLTTGIREVAEIWDDKIIRVYNLSGQLLMVEENKGLAEIRQLLSTGVYIVNGKKIIIR